MKNSLQSSAGYETWLVSLNESFEAHRRAPSRRWFIQGCLVSKWREQRRATRDLEGRRS